MYITKQQEIFYKAIGNYERVHLLFCLQEEQSVTSLLEKCHLSQSALSQHLKILKDADLVSCRREGKLQLYSVKDTPTLTLAKTIISHEQQ